MTQNTQTRWLKQYGYCVHTRTVYGVGEHREQIVYLKYLFLPSILKPTGLCRSGSEQSSLPGPVTPPFFQFLQANTGMINFTLSVPCIVDNQLTTLKQHNAQCSALDNQIALLASHTCSPQGIIPIIREAL